MRGEKPLEMEGGAIAFDASDSLKDMPPPGSARRLGAEQSNVSVLIDDKIMLKIYRRLQPGAQPDVEVGRVLPQNAGFDPPPPYLGPEPRGPHEGGGRPTLAHGSPPVQN